MHRSIFLLRNKETGLYAAVGSTSYHTYSDVPLYRARIFTTKSGMLRSDVYKTGNYKIEEHRFFSP